MCMRGRMHVACNAERCAHGCMSLRYRGYTLCAVRLAARRLGSAHTARCARPAPPRPRRHTAPTAAARCGTPTVICDRVQLCGSDAACNTACSMQRQARRLVAWLDAQHPIRSAARARAGHVTRSRGTHIGGELRMRVQSRADRMLSSAASITAWSEAASSSCAAAACHAPAPPTLAHTKHLSFDA
jgi:hypothetical protein